MYFATSGGLDMTEPVVFSTPWVRLLLVASHASKADPSSHSHGVTSASIEEAKVNSGMEIEAEL